VVCLTSSLGTSYHFSYFITTSLFKYKTFYRFFVDPFCKTFFKFLRVLIFLYQHIHNYSASFFTIWNRHKIYTRLEVAQKLKTKDKIELSLLINHKYL
jgi:hypothetical protein